jgi:hypothetical protein
MKSFAQSLSDPKKDQESNTLESGELFHTYMKTVPLLIGNGRFSLEFVLHETYIDVEHRNGAVKWKTHHEDEECLCAWR